MLSYMYVYVIQELIIIIIIPLSKSKAVMPFKYEDFVERILIVFFLLQWEIPEFQTRKKGWI